MIAIDFLTVTIASVIAFAIGIVWFSILFPRPEDEKRLPWTKALVLFFLLWVNSAFLAMIESAVGATSFWDGVCVGATVWLGLIFSSHLSVMLRGQKSWKSFCREQGYFFCAYVTISGILAG